MQHDFEKIAEWINTAYDRYTLSLVRKYMENFLRDYKSESGCISFYISLNAMFIKKRIELTNEHCLVTLL